MGAPKMTRHEMKQDDLVTAIERARVYVSRNTASVRNAVFGGAIAIVVLGAGYLIMSNRASAAGGMLSEAERKLSAPVIAEGLSPTSTGSTYSSEAERDGAALEAFNDLVAKYGGRKEGKIGRYYQGILLARLGRTAEAGSTLSSLIEEAPSPVVAGLARAQLAQVRAREGALDEAAKIYTEMAADKESNYPRDWALFHLADILVRQGKKGEAASTYQRIVSEFPNSTLVVEATRKAKGA